MQTLKEYFKARLIEDLGSPELMDNIRTSGDENSYRTANTIARSPYLHVPDPKDPSKPMRLDDAKLHPRLSWALANAARHGSGLDPKDVAIIQDFIKKHGHFVGAPDDSSDPYSEKYRTNDPSSVLSNIFNK